ncbi:MAG TPA: hypothetical protein VI895_07355 [Bdellovibrionota bacterium]|nr:hypothetical protein [Bdellovibrionota bacterium]
MNALFHRALKGFLFSKLLTGAALSSISCMAVLNGFHLQGGWLAVLFPLFFLGFAFLLAHGAEFETQEYKISDLHVKLALLFVALMILPRISYLLEWSTDGVVMALGDDYFRLAELISLSLSRTYPVRHYLNQDYLFSFYYCALLPFVFLKYIIPVMTLKDCIFFGNAAYTLLVTFSLMEISNSLFSSKRQISFFLFFCTFFYGLDWIFFPLKWAGHFEWWETEFFQWNAQISSFSTVFFWTIHHLVGAYLILVARHMALNVNFKRAEWKVLVVGLLCVASFYSSVFAFLPVILFLPPHVRSIWQAIRRGPLSTLACLVIAVSLVPLFLNKPSEITWVFGVNAAPLTSIPVLNLLLSITLRPILVPMIEFWGLPLLLFFYYRRMKKQERYYLIAAHVYLGMTYAGWLTGSNNVSMRGMLLPSLVFYFLAAKHMAETEWMTQLQNRRRILWALIILLLSLGTIRESSHQLELAVRNVVLAQAGYLSPCHELARNRVTRFLKDVPILEIRKGAALYCEKLVQGIRPEDMRFEDRELLKRSIVDSRANRD